MRCYGVYRRYRPTALSSRIPASAGRPEWASLWKLGVHASDAVLHSTFRHASASATLCHTGRRGADGNRWPQLFVYLREGRLVKRTFSDVTPAVPSRCLGRCARSTQARRIWTRRRGRPRQAGEQRSNRRMGTSQILQKGEGAANLGSNVRSCGYGAG